MLKSEVHIPTSKGRFTQLGNRLGVLVTYGEYVAVALLITVVVVVNVSWIQQDTRPFPKEDAHLSLRKTLQFIDTVERQGTTDLWQTIRDQGRVGRPPLYQLVAVPFVWLFGRSTDAGLFTNILFYSLLLLSTYGIGRTIRNGTTGLLAAILVGSYPPVVHLSRMFMPHFAVIACVALSLWLLLLLVKTREPKIAWLFGASLAFGSLIRHYFPIYYLSVPTAVFGVYVLLFQTTPRYPPDLKGTPRWVLAKLRDPFVLRGLLPAALIAVGLAAPWYLTEGRRLFEVLGRTTAREAIDQAGFQDVPPSFWWFAQTMPGTITYVLAALLAIGLVVAVVKRQVLTSVLLVTFVVIYAALSMRTVRVWVQFAAVLPAVAALSAVWMTRIRYKLLSRTLIVVCLAVAVFAFSFVTWELPGWTRPVASALGAPLDTETCSDIFSLAFCPNPPADEDWPVSDILQTVLDDPVCQNRVCHLMVAHSEAQPRIFDRFMFTYYLTQDFAGASLFVSEPTEWYTEEFNLEGLLYSDFLVYTVRDDRMGELPETRFLQSPPVAFAGTHEHVASFPLPTGETAQLLRRTQPLTIAEAEASIAALDVSDAAKAQQYSILAPLYARSGAVDEALERYERALEQTSDVQTQAELLVGMGELYTGLGNEAQAMELYRRALVVDPTNPDASAGLAELELESDRPQAAERILRTAIRQNPDAARLHRALGQVYRRMERAEDAILAYQEAIDLEPEQPSGYVGLAGILKSEGRTSEAVELLTRAIEVNPLSGLPHAFLGYIYQDQGDVEKAIAEYQEAIRLEPSLLATCLVGGDADQDLGITAELAAGSGCGSGILPAYEERLFEVLRDIHWDLGTVLGSLEAYSDEGHLVWWPGGSWVKPYPHQQDVLVGRSVLKVEGEIRPGQIFMHPFGNQERTYLQFQMPRNPFAYLHVGYGMADSVIGQTNGVEYAVEARRQDAQDYELLFTQTVTDSVWQARVISLAPYWDEDLDFRISVDARGDFAYDWLQTTVELVPPTRPAWDLATHLEQARFLPGSLPLTWQENGFYTPDGERLVGSSALTVGGQSLPRQVHFHPYAAETSSTMVFRLPQNGYRILKTSAALADEAASSPNGVDYIVSISVDGGQTFAHVVQMTVVTNTWHTERVELPEAEELVLRLTSSARHDATFDWLQVRLALLPFDD